MEALQQQLDNLQQDVVASRTAQQQVADQLQEALNDKAMLEGQMEASLSLVGAPGAVLSLHHSLCAVSAVNMVHNMSGRCALVIRHGWCCCKVGRASALHQYSIVQHSL